MPPFAFVTCYRVVVGDRDMVGTLRGLDILRGLLVKRVLEGRGRLSPLDAERALRYATELAALVGGLQAASAAGPVAVRGPEWFAVPSTALWPDREPTPAFGTNQIRLELYAWTVLAGVAVAEVAPADRASRDDILRCAALVRDARRLVLAGWEDRDRVPAALACFADAALLDRVQVQLGVALELYLLHRSLAANKAALTTPEDGASPEGQGQWDRALVLTEDLYRWRDRLSLPLATHLRVAFLRALLYSGRLARIGRGCGTVLMRERLEEYVCRVGLGVPRPDLVQIIRAMPQYPTFDRAPPVLEAVVGASCAAASDEFRSALDEVALPSGPQPCALALAQREASSGPRQDRARSPRQAGR